MKNKKVTKKDKRRIFLVLIITVSLIFLMSFNILSIWTQIINMQKEKVIVSNKLNELKEEEQYLKVEVEKLQNPDYVARYAREKYLFSRDGEFNIRIQ